MIEDDDQMDAEVDLLRLRHTAPGEYLLHQLGDADIQRLINATDNGVPAASLAVMARWWQLETYLRQLIYIELRGFLGTDWQTSLPQAASRVSKADAHRYMASPDDDYLLAHLDVTPLFELIDQHWDWCEHGIGLPHTVWKGRVEEIKPIRHRLAHCRRPHRDDAARIEQLLRDLEPAANRVFRAYTDWREVTRGTDPVVDAWVHCQHPDAARLVLHGRDVRGIEFSLMASSLPGATRGDTITGSPGWFWVMHASMTNTRMYIDDYWANQSVKNLMPLAAHIIQSSPWTIAVTIPAMQEADVIADAIGGFFDAVFNETRRGDDSNIRHPWRRPQPDLDPRIDANDLLSVISGLNPDDPISIFAASR